MSQENVEIYRRGLDAFNERDGDYTIAKLHNRGHGVGSDAPFEEVLWQVAKWRDGKIVSWQMHGSEAEALEAVGPGT